MRDTRPVACKLFDLNDQPAGEVTLAPRGEKSPVRTIVWKGRRFREGDGTGFYGENEFAELVKEQAQ